LRNVLAFLVTGNYNVTYAKRLTALPSADTNSPTAAGTGGDGTGAASTPGGGAAALTGNNRVGEERQSGSGSAEDILPPVNSYERAMKMLSNIDQKLGVKDAGTSSKRAEFCAVDGSSGSKDAKVPAFPAPPAAPMQSPGGSIGTYFTFLFFFCCFCSDEALKVASYV
jgi:hypothetical protein